MFTEDPGLNGPFWPEPEVEANLNSDEMGDLGLTTQDVEDIVAFLETLTDGYME